MIVYELEFCNWVICGYRAFGKSAMELQSFFPLKLRRQTVEDTSCDLSIHNQTILFMSVSTRFSYLCVAYVFDLRGFLELGIDEPSSSLLEM